MSVLTGWPTSQQNTRLSELLVQAQPTGPNINSESVLARQTVRLVGSDIVESGTTEAVIKATAHSASVGDVIRFTSGTFSGRECHVWSTATDWIYLGEVLTEAPAAADTFEIYRFRLPLVNAAGRLQVDIVSGGGGGGGSGTEYADGDARGTATGTLCMVDDGTLIQSMKGDSSGRPEVNINGTVPISAASLPLPTGAATEATLATLLTTSAFQARINTLGQKTMANSTPVVLPSDQAAIPVTLSSTTITGSVDTELTTADLDTGAGTDTRAVVGLALAASGGALLLGSANPMPISDNSGSITVDYATTGSGTSTGALRVELPTNGTGTLATVSTVTSLTQMNGQAIAMGTGTRSAGTQRVTIATDDVVPASQSGTWNIGTVTTLTGITNALPAGTNAIGKLAANSGVDIGDVTVNNTTATPVYTQSKITGIGHGVKTVTTAGTDVALATTTTCVRVTIQSQTDNTGLIAIGAAGVDATVATGTGIVLYPGDMYELEIDDLADIFIDSTVNGEGVRYTYFT